MQIRAKSGDGAVVLDELAWVRGTTGEVSLYIGHVSRLIRFLNDASARSRFPPAVEDALHAAEQTHWRWQREVEPLFDSSFLEAIEPPVRVVIDPDGRVQQAEHVFGASWDQLRDSLRRANPGAAFLSTRSATSALSRTSIEEFVQACERAASWLRVPLRRPRDLVI